MEIVKSNVKVPAELAKQIRSLLLEALESCGVKRFHSFDDIVKRWKRLSEEIQTSTSLTFFDCVLYAVKADDRFRDYKSYLYSSLLSMSEPSSPYFKELANNNRMLGSKKELGIRYFRLIERRPLSSVANLKNNNHNCILETKAA
jgi:hypothetical protein